ncbi:MAG: hypothetical protein CVU05_03505 [Bacteroidetes bacterium HGW-Bacteroidetes-21]|jgi:tetratricopeptide (TPR) repeat protein|nr:MAG: hypothetical protein CVU05_03505 [Bacteroidetes bacterium HGW-Bacteroidetes-21]
MMNKEENIRRIEAFLDGEMPESESLLFLKELEQNPDLQAEMDLHKTIREAMVDRETDDLRKTLTAIRMKHSSSKNRSRTWYVAASIVGLLMVLGSVFVTLHYSRTKFSDHELFEAYFQQVDAGTLTRNANGFEVSDIQEALNFYDQKNYQKAINLLQGLPETLTNNALKDYFTGLSYMGLMKYNEAIPYFQAVAQNKETLYYEDAIWQSGLCYLKLSDRVSAIHEFKKLQNGSTYYKTKSQEIISKID